MRVRHTKASHDIPCFGEELAVDQIREHEAMMGID